MKQVNKLPNSIEDKIDAQIVELKNMILENYKETDTATLIHTKNTKLF